MSARPMHLIPDIAAAAEKADFVICASKGMHDDLFEDNVFTTCADCGTDIFHRPYVPKAPPKICIQCFSDRMDGGHA